MELQTDIIHNTDALTGLRSFPDNCIDCVVTSPPYYGLRDYGVDGQIGLESSPEHYIENLADIFDEVRRVLKAQGTLWVNLGDSYMSGGGASRHKGYFDPKYKNGRNGGFIEPTAFKHPFIKPKDLIGTPWMLAFELRKRGWYLRQDIIWHKPNPMPESVRDRCTKSHEYLFLLTKSKSYHFDHDAMLETATGYDGRKDTKFKGGRKYADRKVYPDSNNQIFLSRGRERWQYKNLQYDGQTPNTIHLLRTEGTSEEVYPVRNKRDVWTIATKPFRDAHFATFPEALV